MKKLRPIGRIENGHFFLDEKKHKDFFKNTTDRFQGDLQKWFDEQIQKKLEKHKSGYFLIYLKRCGRGTVKLTISFDVERYRNENGDIALPISDLW